MASEAGYFPYDPNNAARSVRQALPFYRENGYVVLTAHATPSQVQSLKQQAAKIISDFRRSEENASVFTTDKQKRKMQDDYFLTSSSNISCFLEEEANNTDSSPKAVNKIGHAMHDLNATFRDFSRGESIKVIAQQLEMNKPVPIQSMYILKNARVGGEVRSHRDATFVHAASGKADDILGLWWALEDATTENGCLWAVRGSHKDGKDGLRMLREGSNTTFTGTDSGEYEHERFVALPCKAGDLVILHGSVVHKSDWNRSGRSRHAYSIHIVEDDVGDQCWIRRDESFPFKPL